MLTLPTGQDIPAIGLGTWKTHRNQVGKAVKSALDLGYRHIDCAPVYNNEPQIGDVLEQEISSRQVCREELWVTSKLWNNAHQPRHVRPALERSLKDLRLDYLDLYLIHWPVHFRCDIMFPRKAEEFIHPDEIPIMETWQAMEKMVKKGLCRHIGVCNFNLIRLKELIKEGHIAPATNQIELHPFLPQKKMLQFCHEQKIVPTAYAPLGSGDRPAKMQKSDEPQLLTHPTVQDHARASKISPAQLLLSWALARGCVVIPKSSNPDHLEENLQALKHKPKPETLLALDALACNYRFVDGLFFTGAHSPYTLESLWSDEKP